MRRTCWLIGCVPAVATLITLVAVGPHIFYGHSDADLFLAVAWSPLGNGKHFPGNHLVQGVAYRYGRIFFPLARLGVGLRSPTVDHVESRRRLRGVGRRVDRGDGRAPDSRRSQSSARAPRCSCSRSPWSGFAFRSSCANRSRARSCCSPICTPRTASTDARSSRPALTILTREALAIAFVPLMWRAYKERGVAGLFQWSLRVRAVRGLVASGFVCASGTSRSSTPRRRGATRSRSPSSGGMTCSTNRRVTARVSGSSSAARRSRSPCSSQCAVAAVA